MNEAGNHGGSDPGETEATLLFASPKFRTMSARKEYECPTLPTEGTLYNFYDQVEQQDLVPMLSGLMGLPIPRNSIGKVSSELRGVFQDDEAYVSLLEQNAHQLWDLIDAVLGHEDLHSDEETRHNRSLIDDAAQLSCRASINTVNKLTCQLRFAEQLTERSKQTKRWDDSRAAYEEFLAHAQHALIDGNRSFSVFHMAAGIATCALALLICLYSIGSSWPSGMTIAIFTSIAACYGITLLGSTSERSEQSFWYLSSSVWIVFLTARAMSRCKSELARPRIVKACVKNLVLHCIAVCWTRLGPMIDRVVFSQHITLKWSTMLVVYSWNSIDIFRHTFGGIVTRSTAVSWTTPLVTAALIFKVSCEQEHAHKIALPFVSDRTFLFRTLLVLTALAALGVCILVARRNSSADTRLAAQHSTLSERLHRLLTLFLITQSRAENMPLFLVLEHQRIALQTLFQHETLAHPGPAPIDAAISVLTLSHNFFFSSGGSNSISSIDLSNAYNGITDYNVSTVGVLLFAANWTGPIWWCSAACDLVPRDRPLSEQHISSNGRHQSADGTEMRSDTNDKHGEPTNDRPSTPWLTYLSTLSTLMALVVLIVMVLCTMRREDSAVWRLWGPKYLYSVFWVLEWHLAVSLGLSSILRALGGVGLKHM
jgi:ethanolaminephosphotransferase